MSVRALPNALNSLIYARGRGSLRWRRARLSPSRSTSRRVVISENVVAILFFCPHRVPSGTLITQRLHSDGVEIKSVRLSKARIGAHTFGSLCLVTFFDLPNPVFTHFWQFTFLSVHASSDAVSFAKRALSFFFCRTIRIHHHL